MDAIFVDSIGNKRNFLYQYDKGQKLQINNYPYSTAPKIQFSIKSIITAYSTQASLSNGVVKASIPNVFLTYGEDIIAYVYVNDGGQEYVVETIIISVYPRKRPSNYTYDSEFFVK